MAKELYDDEVLAGRESPWQGAQDFRLAGGKLQCRGLFAHDIGNPGQINLARIGPDNVDFNHFPPEAVTSGQTLGHISFTGYLGRDLGFGERSAQIHSRFAGNGRGTLTLVTSGVDRLTIDENGNLDLTGLADEDGSVLVTVNGRLGKLKIEWIG